MIDDEDMVLVTLLLSIFLGSAAADTSVSAPRTPDYWEAWGVVFVKAMCDVDGRVLNAEVAQGTAAPAVLDSLVAVVKNSAFEIPHYWGIAPHLIQGIAFVTERHPRESERAGWVGMPEDIQAALSGPAFEVWLRGMLVIAPELDLNDFLASPPGRMMEITEPMPPSGPYMDERREQGLFIDSPGGRWMLDLLANGDVESDGHMGWDVDTALSIHRADTGEIAFQYTLGTANNFWTAAWLDDDRFVVVGSTERGGGVAGKYVRLVAPDVGLFTLSTRSVQWFTWAPIRPEDEARFGELGRIVREAAFPKIDWRD